MLISFLCPTAALDAALAKQIMEGITAKQLEAQVCADYANSSRFCDAHGDRGDGVPLMANASRLPLQLHCIMHSAGHAFQYADPGASLVFRHTIPQRDAARLHGSRHEGSPVRLVADARAVLWHQVVRRQFSAPYRFPCTLLMCIFHVHSHIKGLMKKAGLKIREDVMGNVFGRWEGSKHGAGDHALPDGAMFSAHCTYSAGRPGCNLKLPASRSARAHLER